MRRPDRIRVILLTVLCGVLLCSVVAGAATVRIMPASVTAAVGEVVSLTVMADSAADLAGFQFGFGFDPAVAEVTAIALGGGFDRQVRKSFDNAAGKGGVAGVTVANPPLSGADLPLATIEFRIKGGGATDVAINGLILGHSDGEPLSATASGGRLTSSGVVVATPVVTIISPAPGLSAVAAPVLEYRVSDGVVTVKLDGTVIATRSGEVLPALPDGPYTLRVESVNAVGTGSAEVVFTVDTVKPVVNYFALPTGEYPVNVAMAVTVPVVLSATDNIAVAGYCLNTTGLPGDCTWGTPAPKRFTFAGHGFHTLYAFARDGAGNVSAPLSATVTTVPVARLTVSIAGTAGGGVTSASGIACTSPPIAGVCTAEYPLNTAVTLMPSPSGGALFSGWGDACRGAGNCTVKMIGNLKASAVFAGSGTARLACTTPPAEYASLQLAYADAPDRCMIQVKGGTILENLALDKDKTVTFKGGYDATFAAVTGVTSLDGTLNIIRGTAIFDGLEISGAPQALATDSIAPTGSVAINQGNPYTRSPLVSLGISTVDPSGTAEVCFSTSATCTDWEPFVVVPRPWLFAEGDGVKSINAWFRDGASNASTQPVGADIILDMTPPVVSTFTVPGSDYLLNVASPLEVPVTLTATDAIQFRDYCLIETGNSSACGWDTNAPTRFGFASYGPHILYAFARDAAGNISAPLSASLNLMPTASLALNLDGTGSGHVTSDSGGMLCNYPPQSGLCTIEVPFNSTVALQGYPNSDSLTIWGGSCAGSDSCSFKLTGNLTVSATFTYVEPVQLSCVSPPQPYSLLQAAYDDAPDGCRILIRETYLPENLQLGKAKQVAIKGGYDARFTTVTGKTGLKGLSILKGSAVLDNLELK